MTKIVKHFIDVDDLTAIALECLNCRATLTIPLAAEAVSIPELCPSCKAHWYMRVTNGRNVADVIGKLREAVKSISLAFDPQHPEAKGFTLKVEVSGLNAYPALPAGD